MPVLAAITTYGVSYAGIWAAIAADIIPEDVRFPLVLVWSLAGVFLAFYAINRASQ